MERGTGSARGRSWGSFGLAAVVLIALSATACTAESLSPSPISTVPAAPSTEASPSSSASSSGSSSAATSIPTLPALWTTPPSAPPSTPASTLTPTQTPVYDPTASSTPPLPKGPLPSLSPVPSGAWTGLRWIAIPGGHSPAVPAPIPGWGTGVTLAGFSKGYLEFMWNAHKRTLTPWLSADGLTWKAGTRFDLSIWAASFKEYDSEKWSDHDECAVVLDNFQEGLGSLLLVNHVVCSDGKCGFSSMTPVTTWTSPDGLSWTVATVPSTVNPILISGGSSRVHRPGFRRLDGNGLDIAGRPHVDARRAASGGPGGRCPRQRSRLVRRRFRSPRRRQAEEWSPGRIRRLRRRCDGPERVPGRALVVA